MPHLFVNLSWFHLIFTQPESRSYTSWLLDFSRDLSLAAQRSVLASGRRNPVHATLFRLGMDKA